MMNDLEMLRDVVYMLESHTIPKADGIGMMYKLMSFIDENADTRKTMKRHIAQQLREEYQEIEPCTPANTPLTKSVEYLLSSVPNEIIHGCLDMKRVFGKRLFNHYRADIANSIRKLY